MTIPFTSEELFWGGIVVMILAVCLMLFCSICFLCSGKRLQRKLEEEYGKRRR